MEYMMLYIICMLVCPRLNMGKLTEGQISIVKESFQNLDATLIFLLNNNSDINIKCSTEVQEAIFHLQRDSEWAVTLFDSWGKPGPGMVSGNTKWLGAYEQCYTVSSLNSSAPASHYCMAEYQRFQGIGICVPESCDAADVKVLVLQANLTTYTFPAKPSIRCMQHKQLGRDPAAIVGLTIVSILLCLVLCGTILSLLSDKESAVKTNKETGNAEGNKEAKEGQMEISETDDANNKRENSFNIIKTFLRKLVSSFSILTNGNVLFGVAVSAGSYTCLNGVKVIAMSGVVLSHSLQVDQTAVLAIDNYNYLRKYNDRDWTRTGLNQMVVDPFFIISGMLLTVSMFKRLKKCKDVKSTIRLVGLMYLHRYLRLTPVFAFLLMTSVLFTPYIIGPGPLHLPGLFPSLCRHNWWKNLLYIGNLIPNNNCFRWAWYVHCDMQFYLISPIILIPLYKNRRAGFIILGLFLITTLAANFGLTYQIFFNNTGILSEDVYTKPWTRISPFLVGIVLGYIAVETRFELSLGKMKQCIGWLLTVLILAGCIVIPGWGMCTNCAWPAIGSVLYYTLVRIAFSLALAWIIIMCCSGNAGFLNVVLSWGFFVPICRLAYSVYMLHPVLMYIWFHSSKAMIHIDASVMALYFIGYLNLSILFAAFLYLLVEKPFENLQIFLVPK